MKEKGRINERKSREGLNKEKGKINK